VFFGLRRSTIPCLTLVLLYLARAVAAQESDPVLTQPSMNMPQHEMMMPMDGMSGPLGIGEQRDGSGTSWLPDASPMNAVHLKAGEWNVMLHGNAFVQYIDDGGVRGDRQFGSINWVMGMASRQAAGGLFTGRVMMSLEPLTVGKCGYPDLLATGELCNGELLHDRQHPHDLFMEVAARYQHSINDALAYELYGGPVAEPALGPTAFPHRVSAFSNPLAPISHHWLDATHISFGVVTAGLYGHRWKAEGSIFNGREPDENRYDFDLGALDSYSGRFWFLPTDRWALQISAGHLKEAELRPGGEPAVDADRVTASATYQRPLRGSGTWATTLAWGRNSEPGDEPTNALLAETNLSLSERHIVFGRVELNQKKGGDLALSSLEDTISELAKIQGGYAYEFPRIGPIVPAIGASAWVSVVPDRMAPFYGGTKSPGAAVFLYLHAPAMSAMTTGHQMNH
jgi:hypothetical protein